MSPEGPIFQFSFSSTQSRTQSPRASWSAGERPELVHENHTAGSTYRMLRKKNICASGLVAG